MDEIEKQGAKTLVQCMERLVYLPKRTAYLGGRKFAIFASTIVVRLCTYDSSVFPDMLYHLKRVMKIGVFKIEKRCKAMTIHSIKL